jgi:hypothetical protein
VRSQQCWKNAARLPLSHLDSGQHAGGDRVGQRPGETSVSYNRYFKTATAIAVYSCINTGQTAGDQGVRTTGKGRWMILAKGPS